ncbi:MAG TPA: oligosaccharide flippase family protein [Roseomonas sp.]
MTTESLARSTVVGATWLVLWRFITRALGFCSTLLLARLLVPADFGLVAMASTFAAAVEALSELGLQDALVRHPAMDRKLVNTAFTLQVARATLTASIVALGAPVAAWWFGEPRLEALLFVLAAATFVMGFENTWVVEFRREMRFDRQFRLLAIPRLLQLATTIPLALATGSYWSLLLGTAVSKVSFTALTYAMHPGRPSFGLSRWRELTGFSLWIWATSMTKLVWDRGDPILLGPVIGPARLGGYLLALELAILPISELIAPAADALFAGFASAQRRGAQSVDLALTVAAALLQVVMPLMIAVSCASGFLVAGLLGPRWADTAPLVAIFAWHGLFAPFNYVCSAMLVANGRVSRNFSVTVVAVVVKLTALLITLAFTSDLAVIALVSIGCTAAEFLAFMALLGPVGDLRLRPLLAGVARTLLAGLVTIFVLDWFGLAWRAVAMTSVPALLYCALIGCIALAVFWPTLLLLWLLCGRPAGPEALLVKLAGNHLKPLMMRKPALKDAA